MLLILRSLLIGSFLAAAFVLLWFPVRWFAAPIPLVLALLVYFGWRPTVSLAEATSWSRTLRVLIGLSVFFLLVIATAAWAEDELAVFVVMLLFPAPLLLGAFILHVNLKEPSRLIMNGEGLLAHWQVDKDLWGYFAERDSKKYAKKVLVLGLSIMFVCISWLVMIVIDDGGFRLRDWMSYLSLSTVALIGLAVGVFYPRWRRYKILSGRRDVWIGTKGCCVGHNIYWWGDVKLGPEDDHDIELHFEGKEVYLRYSESGQSFDGDAYHLQHLIPIARGAEGQAKLVVPKLRAK